MFTQSREFLFHPDRDLYPYMATNQYKDKLSVTIQPKPRADKDFIRSITGSHQIYEQGVPRNLPSPVYRWAQYIGCYVVSNETKLICRLELIRDWLNQVAEKPSAEQFRNEFLCQFSDGVIMEFTNEGWLMFYHACECYKHEVEAERTRQAVLQAAQASQGAMAAADAFGYIPLDGAISAPRPIHRTPGVIGGSISLRAQALGLIDDPMSQDLLPIPEAVECAAAPILTHAYDPLRNDGHEGRREATAHEQTYDNAVEFSIGSPPRKPRAKSYGKIFN